MLLTKLCWYAFFARIFRGHVLVHDPVVMPTAWCIVVLMLAINVAWLWVAQIPFQPGGTFWSAATAASVVAMVPVLGIAAHRSRSLMPLYSVIAERLALLLNAIALQAALGLMTLIFTFLATMLGWPLVDGWLSAIDKAMGFDWLAFLALTNANSIVASVLAEAYRTSFPQILALLTFLAVSGRAERLGEASTVLALATFITLAVNLFCPAVGAYAYYTPPAELFANFGEKAGTWHMDLFTALHGGHVRVVDLQIEGLVTFPSFHTALAVVTTYAVRGFRYLFPPVALLNVIVIISTIPHGGHYLVDVIAGVLVAGAAIAASSGLLWDRHRTWSTAVPRAP